MTFRHGIKIGEVVNQSQLTEIFLHNINSGMKYSSTTKTMVLVNDLSDTVYNNRWENNIFYYTGSGLVGNQTLTSRNKRLSTANIDKTEIYIIEGVKGKFFVFMGQFELVNAPFQEEQYDKEGKLRSVWVFPLLPIENQNNIPLPDSLLKEAQREKEKKSSVLSDEELENKAKKAIRITQPRSSKSRIYLRDPFVAEYAKRRSKGICELCEQPAPFQNKSHEPFLESHHIKWLSRGGEDSLENTVALCPNCHRKMHILDSKEDVDKLLKVRKSMVKDRI